VDPHAAAGDPLRVDQRRKLVEDPAHPHHRQPQRGTIGQKMKERLAVPPGVDGFPGNPLL
jgi:hypothetical protein